MKKKIINNEETIKQAIDTLKKCGFTIKRKDTKLIIERDFKNIDTGPK